MLPRVARERLESEGCNRSSCCSYLCLKLLTCQVNAIFMCCHPTQMPNCNPPATPSGQVHHFASYFLHAKKLCQPSDLTTNTTGAAAHAKGVDWPALARGLPPSKHHKWPTKKTPPGRTLTELARQAIVDIGLLKLYLVLLLSTFY